MLGELKGTMASHKERMKQRRRRFLWNLFIVLVILLLLAVVAALLYIYISGRNQPTNSAAVTVVPTKQKEPTKPKVDDNSPVGVAIEAFTPVVKQGGAVSLSVKTRPDAACSVRMLDPTKPTQPTSFVTPGLVPKTADEFGVAMWSWKVDTVNTPGTWPVEITCAYNGRSGYGKEYLKIEPSS